MMRAFIALDPSEAARRAITRVEEEFRKTEARVSWVRAEQVHLTLKFLGDIPPEAVPGIEEALARIGARNNPFLVRPAGCGAFPNVKEMRTVWVGLKGDGEMLQRVQKEVESAMIPLGFPAEHRAFRPHLTVGRVKGRDGIQPLREALLKYAAFEAEPFNISEIVLYRSDLRPDGARYTPLFRALLGKLPGS